MSEEKKVIKQKFKGEVVSDKMDKTVVVQIETAKVHKIYGKKYTQTNKFKVHDPKNEYKVGDIVIFQQCRPLSRDKRWRVIEKVK